MGPTPEKRRKDFAIGRLRCIIHAMVHRAVNPTDAEPLNAARKHAATD
jgi:hypothetical protein